MNENNGDAMQLVDERCVVIASVSNYWVARFGVTPFQTILSKENPARTCGALLRLAVGGQRGA